MQSIIERLVKRDLSPWKAVELLLNGGEILIEGERIRLRAMERDDLAQFVHMAQ